MNAEPQDELQDALLAIQSWLDYQRHLGITELPLTTSRESIWRAGAESARVGWAAGTSPSSGAGAAGAGRGAEPAGVYVPPPSGAGVFSRPSLGVAPVSPSGASSPPFSGANPAGASNSAASSPLQALSAAGGAARAGGDSRLGPGKSILAGLEGLLSKPVEATRAPEASRAFEPARSQDPGRSSDSGRGAEAARGPELFRGAESPRASEGYRPSEGGRSSEPYRSSDRGRPSDAGRSGEPFRSGESSGASRRDAPPPAYRPDPSSRPDREPMRESRPPGRETMREQMREPAREPMREPARETMREPMRDHLRREPPRDLPGREPMGRDTASRELPPDTGAFVVPEVVENPNQVGLFAAAKRAKPSGVQEITEPFVGPPPADRAAALLALQEEIGECVRCSLSNSRSRLVYGEGNPEAQILFVGDAPGSLEEQSGSPMAGEAGKLFDRILETMLKSRREDVYLVNAVLCSPPPRQAPGSHHLQACQPILARVIEIVRPRAIVTLGPVAMKALFASADSLVRMRGFFWNYRGIEVMPTFHPASLLQDPSQKRPVKEDMEALVARLAARKS